MPPKSPLVRGLRHAAKLLILQGLLPSVPIQFALFWTGLPSTATVSLWRWATVAP
jgi:hypothetical protein